MRRPIVEQYVRENARTMSAEEAERVAARLREKAAAYDRLMNGRGYYSRRLLEVALSQLGK